MITMFLYSCEEDAQITIQNKVHNATLMQISWDDYAISSTLLPGQKSKECNVVGRKEDFPKSSIVKFYMIRGENQVYLETKYPFTLDAGQNLLIVISDTASVVNPLTTQ